MTKKEPIYLLAPLVTNRKGHHRPVINWARERGYDMVRCDGEFVKTKGFQGLDRYSLHNIEVLLERWELIPSRKSLEQSIKNSLTLGNGRCLIITGKKRKADGFLLPMVDSFNGESYPNPEPSLLSWNSARGWCSYCRGYGKIYEWMKEELPANGKWWQMEDGETCTECKGERLNPIARNIVLYDGKKNKLSLPQLLRLTPEEIISFLQNIKLEKRVQAIAAAIIPEIIEKLRFMKKVGLDYLSLDRETSSLSEEKHKE